ncbi:BDN_1c_G0000880.mRNA.1.CDS.1 [Saccharomyces cerevisiae]|nr:BDN_1c_G0000880.mRNA.1.CDS.1 [Saccharomyces cerevisiae]CAI7036262.1 BDN_1c_G0000880.mRNA.1.CDS.1 [Saccharomyces cerevisiae]
MIVNNTHVLNHTHHMPHSLALVYWYGIRTRMLQYIPRSTYPTLTFHSMAHLSN